MLVPDIEVGRFRLYHVLKLHDDKVIRGQCASYLLMDGYATSPCDKMPSTSCTGVWLAITMLQYYICLGIVLTVILVLGLGLGFGIILYFVIGT